MKHANKLDKQGAILSLVASISMCFGEDVAKAYSLTDLLHEVLYEELEDREKDSSDKILYGATEPILVHTTETATRNADEGFYVFTRDSKDAIIYRGFVYETYSQGEYSWCSDTGSINDPAALWKETKEEALIALLKTV